MPIFTQPNVETLQEALLQELNTCHSPAGSSSGGQFCSKDSEAPQPKEFKDGDPENEEAWRVYWQKDKLWERKMELAVTLGKITPEDAKALGWRSASNPEHGYEALPDTLYHVSTAYNAILVQGLKTRAEAGGVHRGLGGGADDTISFTADLKTARTIRSALLEARRVARGEITVQQLVRMAKEQPLLPSQTGRAGYMQSQGPRTAYEMLVTLYAGKEWHNGQPLPQNLQDTLKGEVVESLGPSDSRDPLLAAAYKQHGKIGALAVAQLPPHVRAETTWQGRDETFTNSVRRKQTPDEVFDSAWEMYRRYATAREYAGGRMDPMFFMTDPKALAKVPVKDIKILQFKPRPRARGYRVSSLGEWRVHTGKAMRFTGIAETGA